MSSRSARRQAEREHEHTSDGSGERSHCKQQGYWGWLIENKAIGDGGRFHSSPAVCTVDIQKDGEVWHHLKQTGLDDSHLVLALQK